MILQMQEGAVSRRAWVVLLRVLRLSFPRAIGRHQKDLTGKIWSLVRICQDQPANLSFWILFSCKMLTNSKQSSVVLLITLSSLYHLIETVTKCSGHYDLPWKFCFKNERHPSVSRSATCRQYSTVCSLQEFPWLKRAAWDFPGGPMVKNLPSSAGDAGSIPDRGTKIPLATGQLSPCAATTEPAHSGAHTPQLEKPTRHNYWACTFWSPRTATREKPVRQTKSPNTATKVLRAATKKQHS